MGSGETVTFAYTHKYNTDGYPAKRIIKTMPGGNVTTVTYEYEKR